MKRIGIIMSVLGLCGGTAFSQSQLDAFKYSQTELNGTARYLGMGGAFGALGGDISAMNTNPAGLAIYKSSEVVTTLSLSSASAKTDWLGSKVDNSRTKVSFDNIAYVGYFPTANDEGIVSWNVGFSYNRLKNYNRNYTMATGGDLNTSLSDYVAMRAAGMPSGLLGEGKDYNPYNNQDLGDWLSILGYNAGYMDSYNDNDKEYYSAFGDKDADGQWSPYLLQGGQLKVSERGSVDQYDLAFGINISELVMLGATVAITDLNYRMTDRYYGEAGSYLTFMDKGEMKERKLDAATPNNAYYDYEFRSPDKWIFSAAAILGTTALISIDYELMNYKNMRMYQTDGSSNVYTNQDITDNFKSMNTIRVGAEVKVTPQFAVRAGVAYSDSPIKDKLKNGEKEVFTVGTIPNYTIDKGVMNYTVGIGYRFTPNFYTDLACVFRTHKEDVYTFSNMFAGDDPKPFLEAQPATMKTNTTRVALTLGYKF